MMNTEHDQTGKIAKILVHHNYANLHQLRIQTGAYKKKSFAVSLEDELANDTALSEELDKLQSHVDAMDQLASSIN